MNKLLWKIGGEAGFGIMTTGMLFSKIASRLGYHVFDYFQYPSLIRGGHNTYEVIVSDDPVGVLKMPVDFLVCLNKDTFDFAKDRLSEETKIIYDSQEFEINGQYNKINVPFRKIIKELGGQEIMKNTIALAASLAVLGIDLDPLLQIIESQFGRKGQKVIDFNKNFAKAGYNHVKENYGSFIKSYLPKKTTEEKLVLTGNEAFSLGAVIANCGFYCAYPMTPSSSVLTVLAAWQDKTGMVVRHAEDEIAVVNTALGSSFAGTRSAVGTSGGGFALMVEAISFAGVAEIPLVIFLASRPGPATGMPTWTEQGDLLFAVHAGHGEFPKIVLAPGDVEEVTELTVKAFDLADIYQTPVIVMSDMLLSEAHKSIPKSFVDKLTKSYQVRRGKTINQYDGKQYLRHQYTNDGISPRLIPGTPGFYYQANSYEHIENGHTTEDAEARVKQVDKRNLKTQTYLKDDFSLPKVYGDLEKAEIVLVGWGSIKGVVLEALKVIDKKTAFIHFTHVFPIDKKTVKPLFKKKKKYILVENNSQGQLGRLLSQEIGVTIDNKLLKYDGRPFWSEEITHYVNNQ